MKRSRLQRLRLLADRKLLDDDTGAAPGSTASDSSSGSSTPSGSDVTVPPVPVPCHPKEPILFGFVSGYSLGRLGKRHKRKKAKRGGA